MSRAPLIVPPDRQQRFHQRWHVARAIWRDTQALWREFRRPFLTFLIAIFGGGALYAVLHEQAGLPPIPPQNIPYVMLSLMILNPVLDVPDQPPLIVFWYLLPAIGVYVIGQGAVDFVRLFFDRSGRRTAWEVALASTLRNHVIVLGVGHVGLRVVRSLVAMGFEVVAIDIECRKSIAEELRTLNVPIIEADGRLPETLEQAGLKQARSLVICTASDQTNLEAAMRARDLAPPIRMVVRMWDDQFANQLRRFVGIEAVFSASDLAAPSFAAASVGVEITQSLHVNGVDYSLLRIEIDPESFMVGGTITDLQTRYDMDIVLHERADEVDVHPAGETVVTGGDKLILFARHDRIIDLVRRKQHGN